MTIPVRVNSHWVKTLDDAELVAAENVLHADFHGRELAEKARSGGRYSMLSGPTDLVNSWMRWSLVSNETRARGLVVSHSV